MAVVLALVAAVSSSLAGGGQVHPSGRGTTGATAPVTTPSSDGSVTQVPGDPQQLATDLTRSQQIIDDPASSPGELQSAGRFQQLAAIALARAPSRNRSAVLARLHGPAAATLRADLAAAASLSRLTPARKSLPPWKIDAPPPPATLLGYFRAAQARYRVPWWYLAAIELIETDFGRVVGLSNVGAEGPMQFMPATWAEYGIGNVHNPRDAIAAAARYLVGNGAPDDMPDALYHYNPSRDYVNAVRAYAGRVASDPRAYYGYYYWQVIFPRTGGLVILPVGFPRAHPIRLR